MTTTPAHGRGAVLRGRVVSLTQQEQDARDLATPLFPARHPSQATHCTFHGRFRYDPVPDDRAALRRIVEEADIITAHGRAWLLVVLPPSLADYLASLDAATEDDEDSHDAEPEEYAR